MAKLVSPKYEHNMVYKYRWLNQALDDLAGEIGYVFYEFGDKAARKAESAIHERVSQLCSFPHLGINYEGLQYQGNEVRILHIKQVSLIYSLNEDMITLIALWNNRRDDKEINAMIQSRQ